MSNKYFNVDSEIRSTVPAFYNFVEIFERQQLPKNDFKLLKSNKKGGFAIIEAPSKLISSIIDFSKI
ncbi:MAG: hypothetical protein UD961_00740 [Bacteroidales bacterium]|nr:hypothetical protein [Bacteroidales bacterium]